jgi:hypothetical protein
VRRAILRAAFLADLVLAISFPLRAGHAFSACDVSCFRLLAYNDGACYLRSGKLQERAL